MEYIRHCCICGKQVDFKQISIPDADKITMFNYHSLPDKTNRVDVVCSATCQELYFVADCGCVSCDQPCKDRKWYIHVKFIEMGGWNSIRTCCSEKCHKAILDTEARDIDLNYTCWYCNKMSPAKLKKCGKCHVAIYCNKECQKSHWPVHKKKCL